jgi:transposase
MENFDLFPSLKIEDVKVEKEILRISLRSNTSSANCPYCQEDSNRKNGHYSRCPYDLSLGEKRVRLELRVQRYFCLNEHCDYKTFGEQCALVSRNAQRCKRLHEAHTNIAIKLGGEAGSDLSALLSIPISGDTLLRDIHLKSLTSIETARVLGVDDWALKKGERYGTILVDLEKHKVMDVLEGRESDVLANWLDLHPDIEIITRDRSRDYAKAIKEAAPQAEQVADRWHLLQNLKQMLDRWFKSIQKKVSKLPVTADMESKIASIFPSKPSLSRTTKATRSSTKASLERKNELFKQVNNLYDAGMKQVHISKKMGIHRHTVRAYIQADEVPNHQRHARPTSILDPHLQYLEKRLAQGCENASQLWREIVELGYPGKPWQVFKWLQPKRSKPSKHGPKTPRKGKKEDSKSLTKSFLPSTPQLAWLFRKDASDLDRKQLFILEYLFQDEQLKTMYNRVHSFKDMLLEKNTDAFDAWLDEAEASKITILQTFIHGLRLDYDAVKAAMNSVWSNGQVEGQVNKLKLIKRQMYGRASFELLRKRVLLA